MPVYVMECEMEGGDGGVSKFAFACIFIQPGIFEDPLKNESMY